ncbi:uncharacterized protein N7498_007920 [Penicillium cinerascens]|uniref:RING-type E3 ubiquitin transferase n=1 Tax=Penicillium cinerascens TaxID=70096 RepID=A0A9W9MEA4_9EURO|nr:uncharacterized protein N7498_007920 [Penicillium cinerascens]KAJ5198803.1 hypothetical protein N7498_007920 [Penicillium cinerascens]
MRPPRLLLVLFCLIFFPIILTIFSALSSSNVATPTTFAGRTSGLHALFSFNIPSSLFPPSAIISLTDDNSTFFLARPAAFGPLLPGKGLSGQLWVGSGFGEGGLAAGVEGELGCSDIPGWGEGAGHKKKDSPFRVTEQKSGNSGSGTVNEGAVSQNWPRLPSQAEATWQSDRSDATVPPSSNDGTDDHLHHPLPESSVSDTGANQKNGDYVQVKQSTHADIQSLQETAEIQGKVVLLSRGGCGFLEKVKWAQRRGAVALIVGDDTRGGNLVTMYARGDTSNVTIPSLFTSHTTAHLLSSLIPAHSGSTSSLGEALKAFQAKIAGHPDVDAQRKQTTTATAASTPTSTSSSTSQARPAGTSNSSGGFLRAIGSLLGLCNRSGGSRNPEDSRRPPSSGNIDWMVLGSWGSTGTRSDSPTGLTSSNSRSRAKVDENLGLERSRSHATPEQHTPDTQYFHNREGRFENPALETEASSTPNVLRGGSITPGSGEYQSIDKSTGNVREATVKESATDAKTAQKESDKGWFASHFGWGDSPKQDVSDALPSSSPSVQSVAASQKIQDLAPSSSPAATMLSEHQGLWVTLTPTSMSTSPFFDTLLVLVVSPLLTLTVVYALLLLRSRIRRRRWRAPKSVVERLPVRTYHTISSSSSSSTSSPRPSSPGTVSQTSPLLGSGSRSGTSRPTRSRSQTFSGTTRDSGSSKGEKSTPLQSGSTLWRRKYTGRQVECVVCLEEYIDGQSRVMSLPCGHEFHAECITPWLTTRRRTCPICKGDVVRSMAHYHCDDSRHPDEQSNNIPPQELDPGADAPSTPLLIAGVNGDSDTEQNAGLDGHASSAPQSSWRNLASLSFSALSGDTIWHQTRADRNR